MIDNLITERIRKVRKIDEERQELEERIALKEERNLKYEMQKQEFYERFGRTPELSKNAEQEDEIQGDNLEELSSIDLNKITQPDNLEDNTQSQEDSTTEETSSMLESIEMSAGCVADMTKSSVTTPSQKELQLNDILNSKMLDKAKELFDIKKITVKTRS